MKTMLSLVVAALIGGSAFADDDLLYKLRDAKGPAGDAIRAMIENPRESGESAAIYDLRIKRAVAVEKKTWTEKQQAEYLAERGRIEAREAEAARLAVEREKAAELVRIRQALELNPRR